MSRYMSSLVIITITLITITHAAPIRPSILSDDFDTEASTSSESIWRTSHLQHIQQYVPITPGKHINQKIANIRGYTQGYPRHVMNAEVDEQGQDLNQQEHARNIRTDVDVTGDDNTTPVATLPPAHSDLQPGAAEVLPAPVFAVRMSATGMSVSGSGSVSLTVSPAGATGVSVVSDSSRGFCLRRSLSSNSFASGVLTSGTGSLLSTSYTKAIWVNLASYASYPQFMTGGTTDTEQGQHFLGLGGTALYAGHGTIYGGRFDVSDPAAPAFPLNTWVHIAVTYQGNSAPYAITIYRNGKATATRTNPQQSWNGGKATQIGNWNNLGIDACVTDATQYDTALTAAQIEALYTSQLPGSTPAPVQSTPAPTVAPTVAPTTAPTTSPTAAPTPSNSVDLPTPLFAVGASASGLVVSGSASVSVAVSPAAASTAISVISDSIRGHCLRRSASASSAWPASAVTTGVPLTQSYTKAVWVYLYSYASYPQFMSGGTTDTEQGQHFLGLGGNLVYAAHGHILGGRFDVNDAAAGAIPLNTWVHIAVTYQGNSAPYTMTIYRNGQQTATRTNPTQTWNGGKATQIGNWNNLGMDACVTDATQWNTALTAAQIYSLYTSQASSNVIKPTSSPTVAVTPAPTVAATPAPTASPVTSTPAVNVPSFQQSSGVAGSNGIAFTYGKPVMLGHVKVYLIYYGTWSTSSPAYTQLPEFVNALSGSPWWNIATTYFQQNTPTDTRYYLNNEISMGGQTIMPVDTTLAGAGISITDSNVYTIITKAIASGRMGSTVVDPLAQYMLITSGEIKLPSGFCSGYCGWHTQSSYGGRALRYGMVGDASQQCLTSCGANRGVAINGDIGSDNMANILAHELVETATDPALNVWKTATNQENADMCAWQWGTTYTTPTGARANMKLKNGKHYLIQSNWVNHNGGKCSITI